MTWIGKQMKIFDEVLWCFSWDEDQSSVSCRVSNAISMKVYHQNQITSFFSVLSLNLNQCFSLIKRMWIVAQIIWPWEIWHLIADVSYLHIHWIRKEMWDYWGPIPCRVGKTIEILKGSHLDFSFPWVSSIQPVRLLSAQKRLCRNCGFETWICGRVLMLVAWWMSFKIKGWFTRTVWLHFGCRSFIVMNWMQEGGGGQDALMLSCIYAAKDKLSGGFQVWSFCT